MTVEGEKEARRHWSCVCRSHTPAPVPSHVPAKTLLGNSSHGGKYITQTRSVFGPGIAHDSISFFPCHNHLFAAFSLSNPTAPLVSQSYRLVTCHTKLLPSFIGASQHTYITANEVRFFHIINFLLHHLNTRRARQRRYSSTSGTIQLSSYQSLLLYNKNFIRDSNDQAVNSQLAIATEFQSPIVTFERGSSNLKVSFRPNFKACDPREAASHSIIVCCQWEGRTCPGEAPHNPV
jgi:hypothetical protein